MSSLSPHRQTYGCCYKGFLSSTQPPRHPRLLVDISFPFPKGCQDLQRSGPRKREPRIGRKGMERSCPAANPWCKDGVKTSQLHGFHFVLYSPRSSQYHTHRGGCSLCPCLRPGHSACSFLQSLRLMDTARAEAGLRGDPSQGLTGARM